MELNRNPNAWKTNMWNESVSPRDAWRNGLTWLEMANKETSEKCFIFYETCINNETGPIRKFDLQQLYRYVQARILSLASDPTWQFLKDNGIGLSEPHDEISNLRRELTQLREQLHQVEAERSLYREQVYSATACIRDLKKTIRVMAPSKHFTDAINVIRAVEGNCPLNLPEGDSLEQIERDRIEGKERLLTHEPDTSALEGDVSSGDHAADDRGQSKDGR